MENPASTSKKKSHRYVVLRTNDSDKPYRVKKKSRHRSKEEREARKTHYKSTKFIKNRSKRDLAKIKC